MAPVLQRRHQRCNLAPLSFKYPYFAECPRRVDVTEPSHNITMPLITR